MKATLHLLRSSAEHKDRQLNLSNTFTLLLNLSLKEESTNSEQLNNFYVIAAEQTGTTKLSSHKQQRHAFQSLWIEFLKQKLPRSLYHKVLVVLDDKVMPIMVNPLQLSDFLTSSYNIGGATSLLALSGLFRLIHGYNLDYPDFYGKLYALLEPSVFHAKYRARFFFLLDLFLNSTHLPAYLVAAFVKRLCRICLTAPPDGLTVVIPLVYNLLLRHEACRVLIHRPGVSEMASDPYDPTEANPSKCRALDSSLWELKSLTQHYHHSVANEAKKFEQPLPKQETDLASLLDTDTDDLMGIEKKKKLKQVAKTFDVPSGLFGVQDSRMSEMWKWGQN
jgi:U3 small nucleolar RNA-associated protein 19